MVVITGTSTLPEEESCVYKKRFVSSSCPHLEAASAPSLSKGKCVRIKGSGIVKIQIAVLQRMVSLDQVILLFLVAFSMAVNYREESFYYVEWDF